MRTFRADENKEVSFAVKAPNWLGDAILSVPAARALIECARRGRLVVIASTLSAEVFSRIPGTLVFRIAKPGGGLLDSSKVTYSGTRILRKLGPVLVFSFTRSATSALMCYLGGVPRRIGFAEGVLSFLYTDRVSFDGPRGKHLTETYCGLVESVGINVADRIPSLDPLEDDLANGEKLLGDSGLTRGNYICLFPGAKYGPAKRWEASRFALLGDTLVDRLGLDIVILGGRHDKASCESIGTMMRHRSFNLCGKTDFSTLVGITKLSRAVIANDSGGMHLSAALGVPVVGLFFSTDPEWTGPLSPRSVTLYSKMSCSPCFERDCPKGNLCTRNISVDEVLLSLEQVEAVAQ